MIKPLLKPSKFLLHLSLILSSILLLESIFRWFLIEKLTVFIQPILELSLIFIFLLIFIWSAFYAVLKRQYSPFVINLMAITFFYLLTFTYIPIYLHFFSQSYKYEKIIEIVIAENESEDLDKLLAGEPMEIEKEEKTVKILFTKIRGIVDNFAGFVYTSDDSSPQLNDFACSMILDLKKIKQNWFWISCT